MLDSTNNFLLIGGLGIMTAGSSISPKFGVAFALYFTYLDWNLLIGCFLFFFLLFCDVWMLLLLFFVYFLFPLLCVVSLLICFVVFHFFLLILGFCLGIDLWLLVAAVCCLMVVFFGFSFFIYFCFSWMLDFGVILFWMMLSWFIVYGFLCLFRFILFFGDMLVLIVFVWLILVGGFLIGLLLSSCKLLGCVVVGCLVFSLVRFWWLLILVLLLVLLALYGFSFNYFRADPFFLELFCLSRLLQVSVGVVLHGLMLDSFSYFGDGSVADEEGGVVLADGVLCSFVLLFLGWHCVAFLLLAFFVSFGFFF